MHIGGSLANVVVRGDDLSAFGHGVSPVMVAPAGTDTGAAVVGVAARVVEVLVETSVFLPPPLLEMISVPMTITATTPPTMPRFCICRRRWARRSCSWR